MDRRNGTLRIGGIGGEAYRTATFLPIPLDFLAARTDTDPASGRLPTLPPEERGQMAVFTHGTPVSSTPDRSIWLLSTLPAQITRFFGVPARGQGTIRQFEKFQETNTPSGSVS